MASDLQTIRDRNPSVYLEDIVETAVKALDFVEGMSFDQFVEDDRTRFAVARALEVVGEAARHVPLAIRDRARGVPWDEMVRIGDELIRVHPGVDLQVVWHITTEDLPAAKAEVERLLQELQHAEGLESGRG